MRCKSSACCLCSFQRSGCGRVTTKLEMCDDGVHLVRVRARSHLLRAFLLADGRSQVGNQVLFGNRLTLRLVELEVAAMQTRSATTTNLSDNEDQRRHKIAIKLYKTQNNQKCLSGS